VTEDERKKIVSEVLLELRTGGAIEALPLGLPPVGEPEPDWAEVARLRREVLFLRGVVEEKRLARQRAIESLVEFDERLSEVRGQLERALRLEAEEPEPEEPDRSGGVFLDAATGELIPCAPREEPAGGEQLRRCCRCGDPLGSAHFVLDDSGLPRHVEGSPACRKGPRAGG